MPIIITTEEVSERRIALKVFLIMVVKRTKNATNDEVNNNNNNDNNSNNTTFLYLKTAALNCGPGSDISSTFQTVSWNQFLLSEL
jgi:hypothetical protein